MAAAGVFALNPNAVESYHRDNMCDARYEQYKTFRSLLGVPSHKADLTICRDTDYLSLWQLWEGQNPQVTQIVNENFLATGGWMLYLYPHEPFEGKKFTVKSYVFEPEVMQSMADQGVNPLLQVHVEQEEFTVDFKGLAFEQPANFVFSKDGIMSFGQQIKGLEDSLDQTIKYEIGGQTVRAGQKQFLDQLPPKPWPEQVFIDILRNRAIEFGSCQKGTSSSTEANGVQLLVDQYVTPTEVIFPMAKALTYVKQADRVYTTFAKGGSEITNKGIDSDQNLLISRATEYGLRIRSAQASKLRTGQLHNPFVTRSVQAEFYPAEDLGMKLGGQFEYKTTHRTITIGDSQNTKRDITVREMLQHSGIWDVTSANGEPTAKGQEILHILANWKEGTGVTKKRNAPSGSGVGYQTPTIRALYSQAAWESYVPVKEAQEKAKGAGGGETKAGAPTGGMLPVAPPVSSEKATAILDEPATLTNMLKLANYDMPIPINFILLRPRIVFEVGAIIVMRSGPDTGRLLLTEVQVNFERRPKTRMIAVHLNFSARTVITKQQRKNIALFREAYIHRLVEGYSTEWAGSANDSSQQGYGARGRSRGDLYCLPTPPNFNYKKMYLDKTGVVNSRMLQPVGLNQQPLYPTAKPCVQMYQWPNEGTDEYTLQELINPSINGKTLAVRGAYRIHTPLAAGLGDTPQNEMLGKSPLGEHIGDQLWNVIAGKPTTLEENIQRLS